MTNAGTGIACTHCTGPIDPFAAFCSTCGAPGPATPTRQPAPSPPPSPRRPAATDYQQSVQSHAWLLLVAGVAVVAGFFLPWITAHIPIAGEVTVNGTDAEIWGPLGGGALLVLLALQFLTSRPTGSGYTWPLALLVGLGTAVLSAALYQSVVDQLGALDNQGIRGDYGIGLWLLGAGVLLSILAAVGGWGATRRATTSARP